MLVIYTDGACSGNPGPGGFGALLQDGNDTRTISGFYPHTTNNRMELEAAIRSLACLTEPTQLQLFTDSRYVQQGITTWIHGWKRNGWRSAAGGAIKNPDLWQRLDRVIQGHQIAWCWVKGHSGDPGNVLADALARVGVEWKARACSF